MKADIFSLFIWHEPEPECVRVCMNLTGKNGALDLKNERWRVWRESHIKIKSLKFQEEIKYYVFNVFVGGNYLVYFSCHFYQSF
jgi:hypothetical protein